MDKEYKNRKKLIVFFEVKLLVKDKKKKKPK